MTSPEEARIIPRDKHVISRRNIDRDALKVLSRLNGKGYRAYIVGGGVRDLLLEERPKDFDVATDARPREVKRLFRNCWLIGRRFRLAHVKFGPKGDKVIEVSTFRSPPEAVEEGDEVEMLADDNVFGDPQSDACRRDFTINALFYSIEDFSVIDWVGGYDDIQARLIRSIGDPRIRFREDPVRMLRAIKFSRRLDFDIAPDDDEAARDLAPLLGEVSDARLTDEVYKIFKTRRSRDIFAGLDDYGLSAAIAPRLGELTVSGPGSTILDQVDRREAEGSPLDRCQVWAMLIDAWEPPEGLLPERRDPSLEILDKASVALEGLRVSRRDMDSIRRLLGVMRRITSSAGRHPRDKVLRQSQFAMALDILELAVARDPSLDDGRVAEWRAAWDQRGGELAVGGEAPAPRRRRRRRRKQKVRKEP